jgi:hypothetical protein
MDWQNCLTAYTTCTSSCTYQNRAFNMLSCNSCISDYQSCTTSNPMDW